MASLRLQSASPMRTQLLFENRSAEQNCLSLSAAFLSLHVGQSDGNVLDTDGRGVSIYYDADEDNGYCETAPAYLFQFTCPFPIPLHFQLVIHVLFAKNLQDFLTIRLMLWISCVWHEFLQKLYLDCSFRLLIIEIFVCWLTWIMERLI